jgi:hypothetical protein
MKELPLVIGTVGLGKSSIIRELILQQSDIMVMFEKTQKI